MAYRGTVGLGHAQAASIGTGNWYRAPEPSISISRRVYPDSFRNIVRSRYVEDEGTLRYIMSAPSRDLSQSTTPGKENVLDRAHTIELTADGHTYSVDIVSDHFDGVRAGDIVDFRERGTNGGQGPALVEGYSYDVRGHDIVMWTRSIRGGRLSPYMYYVHESDWRKIDVVLSKKRGEYDPRSDYGIGSFDRQYPVEPEKLLARVMQFKQQVMRETHDNPNGSLKEPMSVADAYRRFNTILLKGELTDLLRRLNKVLPLKNLEAVERDIASCSSPRQVQRWEFQFFRNLERYLRDSYSSADHQKIRALCANKQRQIDVILIQMNVLKWVSKSISHKIGMRSIELSDPEEGTLVDRLTHALDHVVQQVAAYLAPLYQDEESYGDDAFRIVALNPVYARELIGRYPDAAGAARHVVSVALNAASSMVESAYSYDFKHVVDQYFTFFQNPHAIAAFKVHLFGRIQELDAYTDRVEALFDRYEERLEAFHAEVSSMHVTRASQIGDVVDAINAKHDKLEALYRDLAAHLGQAAEKTVGKEMATSALEELEAMMREARADIGLREALFEVINKGIGEMIESPGDGGFTLDAELADGYQPLADIKNWRSGFLGRLRDIRKIALSFKETGTPLGKGIYHDIVDRINNPTGKQLPLASAMMYFDGDIYTVYPFAPHSSSGNNVLRLEISTGCDWGRCTYCSLYEDEPFSLATRESFARHMSLVREYLGSYSFEHDFDRVFLSGGNGLSMPTERLVDILGHVRSARERKPRQVESYATTRAILHHGAEGLWQLRKHGLNLVYWGVESGNDSVLKMIGTGYTQRQVREAGDLLNGADIMISATVMPGVSGTGLAEGHERDTAEVLGAIYPRFVTFMGVHAPGSEWERLMLQDPSNDMLTVEQMIEHQKRMRDQCVAQAKANPRSKKELARVSAHGPDVTPASCNPITFETEI